MRILVTGVAGMIGTPLANRLAADGHTVVGVDDMSGGHDLDTLDSRVRFSRADVRDVPKLWSLLADVDVVIHLAARVSVTESILYPVEYNNVNTGGTVSLMAAARDAGVRRVVFGSSGTVYGAQGEQPIAEMAVPRPANPYAVSKVAAEHYVRAIGELYRIETVILRLFNVYGSRRQARPNHPAVIPHFVHEILAGASIVLHGDPPGGQTRDFVHLDDVVEALVRAAAVGGISGAVLNVGSGVETAIAQLVPLIEAAAGRPARVLHSQEQSGGSARMCADIAAARAALGWSPRVDLPTGLARLVDEMRAGVRVREPQGS